MTPIEIYLDERLISITGTNQTEVPVPGVPMVINYSGDNWGARVSIKHPDEERMTDFPLLKVGEEKTMRFEQTEVSSVEENRSRSVRVRRVLKFKRT